jgi:hypothetical protein
MNILLECEAVYLGQYVLEFFTENLVRVYPTTWLLILP